MAEVIGGRVCMTIAETTKRWDVGYAKIMEMKRQGLITDLVKSEKRSFGGKPIDLIPADLPCPGGEGHKEPESVHEIPENVHEEPAPKKLDPTKAPLRCADCPAHNLASRKAKVNLCGCSFLYSEEGPEGALYYGCKHNGRLVTPRPDWNLSGIRPLSLPIIAPEAEPVEVTQVHGKNETVLSSHGEILPLLQEVLDRLAEDRTILIRKRVEMLGVVGNIEEGLDILNSAFTRCQEAKRYYEAAEGSND